MTTAPLTRAHRRDCSNIKEGPTPSKSRQVAENFCIALTLPQSQEEGFVVLMDSGATANFIDFATVKALQILTVNLTTPMQVETIDGQTLKTGLITHAMTPCE